MCIQSTWECIGNSLNKACDYSEMKWNEMKCGKKQQQIMPNRNAGSEGTSWRRLLFRSHE